MKKWIGILFIVMLFATCASADTLMLKTAPYGQNGPYGMSLNGAATTTPMICYSQHNTIPYNETWTVQAYTIATIGSIPSGSPFAGTADQYNVLGYLADMLFADPGNAALQNAIWAVLPTGACALNTICSNAMAFVTSSGYQTSDIFYLPTSNTSLGVPQPFIVHVPEPGSMVLLGAGLLGLISRKRKLAA